jgi:hypothetical protein
MSSLCFDMTLSQPLRLHIDRGLKRHGTHGSPPTRVVEVPAMWTWPVGSPTDLQVDPETLSTTLKTLEDLGRPYPDPGKSVVLWRKFLP